MLADKLIQVAIAELGEKDISEAAGENSLHRYAQEVGLEYINEQESPWCGIFLKWCAVKAGLKGCSDPNPYKWLKAGQPTAHPVPGDIAVLGLETNGSLMPMAGIFLGFSMNGDKIFCVGGTPANLVTISGHPVDMLLGFRRLVPIKMVYLPDSTLSQGDRGTDVMALQDAIKIAGFVCGTSDGEFGPATRRAVENAQEVSRYLRIDGVYGSNTRSYLESITENNLQQKL